MGKIFKRALDIKNIFGWLVTGMRKLRSKEMSFSEKMLNECRDLLYKIDSF